MEIVISIAAKIAEYTVAPVGQWLCYSFHYSKNMEHLKNQKEKLQNAKDRWEQSVNDALRKGEEIHSDVNKWLTEATRILRECEEKAEARSTHATCVNLKQRHRLSREANKIAGNIVKHLENGNFNPVSYLPAAQDRMVTTRHKNYVTLESRTSVANEVMEALGDANIKKIGVWGMPGVGKSTLMKEIERRAKEEKLFHGVVLAAVTERPELSRIRGEIAVMLNQERHRQQTEIGRANLQQESSTKDAKLLVILDDIWPKQLELEDIGIPSEGCKVVLTSRNRDVLVREMGTQKNFELESLVEEEAWNLFEQMAGDSVKDPDVREVAIKVAKECAGLPLALTTVSKALKGKSLSVWKDAELRLKRPPPVDVPEILSPIYSCIELSYNQLADEEHKSLILLCALLDHYYGIYYLDLLKYCFGLGLFQGIVTLEEARVRLDCLVRDLQDSCLLLESSNSSGIVYMHDVVHYVATIIGSKYRNTFAMRDNGGLKAWPDVDSLKRCQAFSILGGDIDQLPDEMECPELRLFNLCLENRSLQIPDTFFYGMDKLNVLDLTNTQLPSLPSSLLLLGNLQTLCLDACELGDISGIGKLKNLKILSFLYSNISKLPREIVSLVCLRLLDLSNCSKLEMIPPNVISSLVKLEELYMGNSFIQWEFEGPNDERKNASLDELKHLSNLTTLEIQIPDADDLPKDLMFEKLERYTICIGDVSDRIYQCSRTLKLKLNSIFQLEFWIKMLLKRSEDLHLDGLNGVKSVIPEIDEEGFQQLMHLWIQNNGEIKHILNLRTPIIAFPTLETFVLKNIISLKEICHGKLCSTSFKNLRVLKVESCDKLRYVFSSSIAGGLPILEELEVKSCNNMGAIVVKEEEDGIEDGNVILFHQLHTLVLQGLPKLMSFLSTKDSFMADCGEIIAEGNHDIHMPLLHHQVAFPRLKNLIIKGLPKIKHVWSLKSFFPTSVISHLEQLKILDIDDCGVEEIVAYEGGREAVLRCFVFPQVTRLDLHNLHRLKWFYKGVHVSKWPMLKDIWIKKCGKVKIFASGVVNFQETVEERQSEMSIKQTIFFVDEHSFPSLESLDIWHMDMLEIIWQDQVTASSFSNIQNLSIWSCPKLLHVFQSNLLTTTFMRRLSILHITSCSSLETIFEKLEAGQNIGKESQTLIALKSRTTKESIMREDGGAARHFVLPTFTHVTLIGLPKLKWILEGEHTLEWPSLKELRLSNCEQVVNMIFAVKEYTFPNLEILSLKFDRTVRPSEFSDFPPSFLARMPNLLEFDAYNSGWEEIFPYELLDPEVQVLTVPRLRRLKVFRLPMLAHLWKEDTQPCPLFHKLEFLKMSECGKLRILVPSSVYLQNLTDLSVSNCHGLINLVTSSTARTLLQLNRMSISKCEKITKIVAMEDGEANVAITFNKLTYLELDGLPNLTYFCSGAYSFGFPSLEKVIVRCCPEMKTFCQGILSTPKLKGVQETKDDSHWEHDLNTTTLRLWESNRLFRERVENSEEDEDHP